MKKLKSLPPSPPPNPWVKVVSMAVGGLVSVGWIDNSDFMLVVSSQGRSIIDGATGEKIERSHDEYYEDGGNLIADGIGRFGGEKIRVAGLSGGGLPLGTDQGWQLFIAELQWPEKSLFLVEPGSNVYGSIYGQMDNMTLIGVESELRAIGFSPTGNSLVVATSSGLTLYNNKSQQGAQPDASGAGWL